VGREAEEGRLQSFNNYASGQMGGKERERKIERERERERGRGK
jgi:hypothetical protein